MRGAGGRPQAWLLVRAPGPRVHSRPRHRRFQRRSSPLPADRRPTRDRSSRRRRTSQSVCVEWVVGCAGATHAAARRRGRRWSSPPLEAAETRQPSPAPTEKRRRSSPAALPAAPDRARPVRDQTRCARAAARACRRLRRRPTRLRGGSTRELRGSRLDSIARLRSGAPTRRPRRLRGALRGATRARAPCGWPQHLSHRRRLPELVLAARSSRRIVSGRLHQPAPICAEPPGWGTHIQYFVRRRRACWSVGRSRLSPRLQRAQLLRARPGGGRSTSPRPSPVP